MEPIRHLYVHIPFCPKVCPYCSFYKEASDRNKTQAFLDAVLLELEGRLQERAVQPDTIFFGGGTPSALSTSQLSYLLGGLQERLSISQECEWTLEMNPATVSLEKALCLRELGVNRISMGVQSWDADLLKILGRVHSAEQAERSYCILREAGFENINLDLIFAVPTQQRDQWLSTLQKTIRLRPEHISAYCLTYEEDTAFYKRFQAGEYQPDDAWDADLFEATMLTLAGSGYEQYEISNYAMPGHACRHNMAYWTGRDYLGLGPSAFSTVGGRRWQNIADTATYSGRVTQGLPAEGFQEAVPAEMRTAEQIAFSLRTGLGVERSMLSRWPQEVQSFEEEGLLHPMGDRLVLTQRGRMVADAIAETFV